MALMADELPPGTAVDRARRSIRNHATGNGCDGCEQLMSVREIRAGDVVQVVRCVESESALRLVITERAMPAAERHLVTVVARQVLLAHWPRTEAGCIPCREPDCEWAQLAGTWLDVVGDPLNPRASVTILAARPSAAKLRGITGL